MSIFLNKMFSFHYNDVFDLIPVCLSCSIVFPAYLDQCGNKHSFISLVASLLFSKVLLNRNGGFKSLIISWQGLLSLSTRLAMACSGLGLLLTDYHGIEEVSYHLFPAIPWLMPVTIALVLAALVAVGLHPSHSLKLSFNVIFIPLVSFFITVGMYNFISLNNEIVLSLKLEEIDKISIGMVFFLHLFMFRTNGRRYNNGMNMCQILLLVVVIGILSTFNQNVKCDGMISCLKTLHNWSEPLTLALTIGSIGLCLPDLFVAAQNFLDEEQQIKKIMTVMKAKVNNTVVIGMICAGLVYLCSLPNLIILSGASLLLQSAIENLMILLNISTDEKSNNLSYSSPMDDSDLDNSLETEDEPTNTLSETESSSSDIDMIVEEYKAQIKIMSGDIGSAESKLKRLLYLSYVLTIMLTIFAFVLSYSIHNRQLITVVISIAALNIFTLIHQWVSMKCGNINSTGVNGLKVMCGYIIYILVLAEITKVIWFYLLIWNIKGIIIYGAYKHIHTSSEVRVKHFLAIKESLPVVETSCAIQNSRKTERC